MIEVPARFVLWVMAFLSYALQNILTSNISIAITDMVDVGGNRSQINFTKPHSAETFAWNEAEQALILGAVYWLMPVGNVASAMISHILGPKRVIGYSILFSSLLNVATPFAAIFNYTLLIILRVVLGFVIGLAFPSVLTIVPFWIPLNERGTFVSCVVGYNFGSAIVNFLGCILIDFVNWKAVFYVPGIAGVVWCLAWKYLMYDRPDQHPRMPDNERELLSSMNAISKTDAEPKREPIPWKAIFMSAHVWINIFTQFGCVWTWLTFTSYGPLFLKTIHNMSVTTIGFAIGSPFVLRVVGCLSYSVLTDYLISNKFATTTNIRKLSIIISNIIPSIFLVVQILFEENTYVTITSITLIILFTGMNINGGVASLIDISPNFGGAIQGIAGAVTLAGGFMIPIVVGYLTLNNNTIQQWRKFFIMTSALCFSSGVLFVLTWNSGVKEWNDDQRHTRKDIAGDQELKSPKLNENGTKSQIKDDNLPNT